MPLSDQPRFKLASLPTPLHELPNLRANLGGPTKCPHILIKRDDLTGLAFGGNKVRKLEFLVADALAKGATTFITAGAVQSNHARATAAAARVAGLRAVLVLESASAQPEITGNLLLDHLLQAEIRLVESGANVTDKMEHVRDELISRGEVPYVIPVGGSSEIGAFGYVAATLELLSQLHDLGAAPTRAYYASGSRGTQAGIELGARAYHAPYKRLGVIISPGDDAKRVEAARLVNGAASRLGLPIGVTAQDMLGADDYMGSGYAAPTDGCNEAVRLLASTEAIFLDLVYSGKAMAALIDHVRLGQIDPDETILFWHTGGQPALFARSAELLDATTP